jgi:serine/threonine-protein kinase
MLRNRRWKSIGSITSGIDSAGQEWVDTAGNLYVTNGQNVVEYAPGSTSPSFTYSDGLQSPVDVTTNSLGDVYVADLSAEFIAEFPQNSNTISAYCFPGEVELASVAVDGSGDVFVAYSDGSGSGHIVEYRGGLSGCNGTVLGVDLQYPGGMALDENNDLLVCDGSRVVVIKPPYSSVSGTLGSGYDTPISVRINKRNDEAYVVDWSLHDVFVFGYPVGSLIKRLGNKNGISEPTGAVDSQNFNP